MFDMAKLLIDWNDPKLPDKARQFFLELYAEKRAESLARHANRTVPSAALLYTTIQYSQRPIWFL